MLLACITDRRKVLKLADIPDWTSDLTQDERNPPKYVNSFEIFWSQWDFLYSFQHVFKLPGNPGEIEKVEMDRSLVSRMVMSPQHAKAFLEVLRAQVEKFENKYGEIVVSEEGLTR